ncbi:MAG: ABC transporter ATP-binding protein [Candidatus Niyogibacteria bacterium]|nr:MAG: ABC transporter ATP-binding protein [Candidatus Niyogibacteria bacterium]
MTMGVNKIVRIITLAKSAFGQYKWQIALLAGLSFLSGVLDVVGINAIIPIFSVIQGGGATDIISKTTKSFFLFFGVPFTVRYLMIFMALMFSAKAAFLFASKYINLKIAADYEKNTRNELFRAMVESNWPHLARQKAGHLSQVLIMNVERGSSLLIHLGGSALIVTNFLVYGFLALNVSFLIAMLAFAFGGIILLVFKPLYYRTKMASEEMVRKYKDLAHYTDETVLGMKAVKSARVEEPVLKLSSKYFSAMRKLYLRIGFLRSITDVLLQPIAAFFILGILAVFYKTGTLHFVSFAVIIYAINRVFSNVQAAQTEIHVLNSDAPHVLSILAFKEEAKLNKEKETGTKSFQFGKSIEFRNVGFSYDGDSRTLSDINFSVAKGEMLGIIGPSGAGKSTLVDLFLRLQIPQKGAILADGENIKDIKLGDWRANIAYVSQEAFLMNDTIYENIRFYNEGLNKEDIIDAAKLANIYDFIQALPDGFETVVGERGMRLSGGERQRVVLARALVRKPQILILDEATSSLDNESELLIQRAVEKLRGKMTIIVIAHRLSTVENSDKLVVLENGRVSEAGAPTELLRDKHSYFFKVYNLRK